MLSNCVTRLFVFCLVFVVIVIGIYSVLAFIAVTLLALGVL